MSENATLSAKQRRAIEELLLTANVKKAADAAGVVTSTVYRWRSDPAFSNELKRRQRESLDDVMLALHKLTRAAVKTYIDALREDSNMAHRLRAADAVFAHLLRLSELLSVQERMDQIEALLHEAT